MMEITFFIDQYKDKRIRKERHSSYLINKFEKCYENKTIIAVSIIDLFDLSNIFMNIVKHVFPSDDKSPNTEIYYGMIISHFNCKYYGKIYDNFYKIV
jgi:hypothetical protein